MRSRPNRDLTTIAKVIFTPFKKFLRSRDCPVNLDRYFQVCEYSQNHRTLLDFELPFLYVEILDEVKPGSLDLFKQYMVSIKHEIVNSATSMYGGSNTQRL